MLPEQVSKLNTLIDSLEICNKGKGTVRDILSIVINQNLKPAITRTYSRGQRLFSSRYAMNSEYLIAYCSPANRVAAINLSAGDGVTATGWHSVDVAWHITQAEMDKILPDARLTSRK